VPGPLSDVKVLEVGGYVTAPFATALMAQLGADVIKIEEPRAGDPFRKWSSGDALSPTFTGVNHNKRSVALDLHDPAGFEAFLALVAGTDVLIDNLRSGALERRGLDEETARRCNPRLIHCSITGFGDEGPYRDRPGYDTIGQGMSGLLGLLTDLDDPRAMGTSLSDHVTGIMAVLGVLAALHERDRTGVGVRVGTSLLEASIAFLAESTGRFLATGVDPDRQHRARLAQVYCLTASDGAPFVIHLSSPKKFWLGLVKAFDCEGLADDIRFADIEGRRRNHGALQDELQERAAARSRDEWLERLEQADVPCAPINRLSEVFADPQVSELGLIVEHRSGDGTTLAHGHVASPLRFDGERPRPDRSPPFLGEHSLAVLTEAGLPAAAISDLIARDVVRGAEAPASAGEG